MKRLYEGKTKDVYELDNGNYLLKFKDDVTGDAGVFDPGANTVGMTLEGAGQAGLKLTTLFFEILKERNIPTHFIASDLDETTMTVIPADAFGDGLEVICRYRAAGSFLRRYGKYAEEGQELDKFVEVTLKDDERNDPPISRDALSMLGILSGGDYETLKQLTIDISDIIKEELARKNIELYDIKLEFGRDKEGNIILIDEISGGNMRVCRDGKAIDPIELANIMTTE
ncbi:phosphoribosylaminoimidazolesuccinocarboxamide synthase [Oceanobacillus indicireducens]|uniref:Phosphoribosylaminoimidazole-succinocarboxamide synthase n=1 Tax=Oceanobacillus indicireducens TaxID=1004261 RepID=A0A917XRJ8_9BACI|nr:phosphoribosylaminoimidazolesuccinocarboxamide synthase [Oceanobacillus indicireducens]GGN50671.1 phosphoribosylaminoimidazolesuccinocarboxamide synthase [Oceanobacillus indicireducens]